jgi:hypothetical protein
MTIPVSQQADHHWSQPLVAAGLSEAPARLDVHGRERHLAGGQGPDLGAETGPEGHEIQDHGLLKTRRDTRLAAQEVGQLGESLRPVAGPGWITFQPAAGTGSVQFGQGRAVARAPGALLAGAKLAQPPCQ